VSDMLPSFSSLRQMRLQQRCLWEPRRRVPSLSSSSSLGWTSNRLVDGMMTTSSASQQQQQSMTTMTHHSFRDGRLGYRLSSSSTFSSNVWRQSQQSQQSQRLQVEQKRYYYYVPTTWEELTERCIRWMEREDRRLVPVKLVSRRKMKQPQQQLQPQQQRKHPLHPSILHQFQVVEQQQEEETEEEKRRRKQQLQRQIQKQNLSRILTMGKISTRAKWNSLYPKNLQYQPPPRAVGQNAASAMGIPMTTTPPPRSSIIPTENDMNNNYNHNPSSSFYSSSSSAVILPSPLPPFPPPSTSITMKSRLLGWKSLRKEQYQGWKSRQKEEYQGWKSRRKEEYQGWKIRKKEQYQQWKTKYVLLKEYSKPEWFDPIVGRPLTSKDVLGRYVNPWQSQSTNGLHSPMTLLKWRWQRFQRFLTMNLSSISSSTSSSSSLRLPLSSSTTTTTIPFPVSTTTTVQEGLVVDLNQLIPIPRLSSKSSSSQRGQEERDDVATPISVASTTTTSNISGGGGIAVTWIGHSTCYVQMDGFTMIMDPIFSPKSSPYQQDYIPIGETRYTPPSHSIPYLVDHAGGIIDFCCITHDHYDHMDRDSVLQLSPHVQMWIVPLEIGTWLVEQCHIDPMKIVELKWWEGVRFVKDQENGTLVKTRMMDDDNNHSISSLSTEDDSIVPQDQGQQHSEEDENGKTKKEQEFLDDDSESITIHCCPASHWGSRTMFDRNKRLWGSFAITTTTSTTTSTTTATLLSSSSPDQQQEQQQQQQRFFFCGDTGLPETFPLFRQIGDAFGPFDLACIPIGAYEPADYNKDAHVTPEEAFQIHQDIMSRYSVGIHWGTFTMGDEPSHEPPIRLQEAVRQAQLKNSTTTTTTEKSDEEGGSMVVVPIAPFETIRHGSTVIVNHRS